MIYTGGSSLNTLNSLESKVHETIMKFIYQNNLDYHLLSNLLLPVSPSSVYTQIDHILIIGNLLFILDSKDLAAKYSGSYKDNYWTVTKTLPYTISSIEPCYNPFKQQEGHCQHISNILKGFDVLISTTIIFNDTDLTDISDFPSHNPDITPYYIQLDQLNNYLICLKNCTPSSNGTDIAKLLIKLDCSSYDNCWHEHKNNVCTTIAKYAPNPIKQSKCYECAGSGLEEVPIVEDEDKYFQIELNLGDPVKERKEALKMVRTQKIECRKCNGKGYISK